MRTAFVLVLLGTVVCTARPQSISARALGEALGIEVERWSNAGRLVARWPLQRTKEMRAFKLEGERRILLITNEGLRIVGGDDGRVACTLRELHFKAPFELELEVNPRWPTSSLTLMLGDGEDPRFVTLCAFNTRIYGNEGAEVNAILRSRNGRAVGDPVTGASTVRHGAWTKVSAKLGDGVLSIAVNGRRSCVDQSFPHASFSLALGSWSGEVRVRNLAVDSKVVRESIRKLVRTADASKRHKGARLQRAASRRFAGLLAREIAEEPTSKQLAEELGRLTTPVAKLVEEAESALAQGNWPAALTRLRRAGSEARRSALPALMTGQVWLAVGDLDQARKATELALKRREDLPEAWSQLGSILVQQGDAKEAFACLDRAQKIAPGDPWIHLTRARLHLRLGSLSDAEGELRAALELRPKSRGLKLFLEHLACLKTSPEWDKTYRKKNKYYLVESNVSAKACADLARRLLYYRRFLEKAFPLPTTGKVDSRVWIFDSEKGYEVFANTLESGAEHSDGVYHPVIKTLLLNAQMSSTATQNVLFHEAFHQYLDQAVAFAPIWLNEGLAEYYGATTFNNYRKAKEGALQKGRLANLRRRLGPRPTISSDDGGPYKPPQAGGAIDEVLQVRRPDPPRNALVPFETLMMMGPRAFMDEEMVAIHYAQSWAMVHFFKHCSDSAARVCFNRYCAAVVEGKGQRAAFEAGFKHEFAPPITDLERALGTYLGKLFDQL